MMLFWVVSCTIQIFGTIWIYAKNTIIDCPSCIYHLNCKIRDFFSIISLLDNSIKHRTKQSIIHLTHFLVIQDSITLLKKVLYTTTVQAVRVHTVQSRETVCRGRTPFLDCWWILEADPLFWENFYGPYGIYVQYLHWVLAVA